VKPERAERYRREHEESMARLRRITGRPLADRRTRTRLAVAFLVAVAVAAVPPLASASVWADLVRLGGMLAAAGLWVALRRATRLITEAPDEALDELLVRLRSRCYHQAYRVLGAVVLLAAFPLLIGQVTEVLGQAIGISLLGLVMGLPVVVAAVTLPDVDEDVPAGA
jgi:hypothetical protein